jgi:hypothetical protein
MQRSKRTPGESRINDPKFQKFLKQIRENSTEIGECRSRVLRLKPTVSSNARPEEINLVLEALKVNWRVEVLYIQNFELVSHCPLVPSLARLMHEPFLLKHAATQLHKVPHHVANFQVCCDHKLLCING